MKLIMLILLLLGVSFAQPTYTSVTVQELVNARETDFLVLDVRQPEEFAVGHVPNAVLIPLGDLQAKASEIPTDIPVYVICRSGNRSRQASKILVELGFQDVRNVDGGVLAWQEAGYTLEIE